MLRTKIVAYRYSSTFQIASKNFIVLNASVLVWTLLLHGPSVQWLVLGGVHIVQYPVQRRSTCMSRPGWRHSSFRRQVPGSVSIGHNGRRYVMFIKSSVKINQWLRVFADFLLQQFDVMLPKKLPKKLNNSQSQITSRKFKLQTRRQ